MPKLTDTQTVILSRAATRPDALAMPLPEGLHGAAAMMSVTKMIEHGWLEEVDADIRKGEPLWRETGAGHGTTLMATDAGLLGIGIDPVVVKTTAAIRTHAAQPPAPKRPTPRTGTKQAMLIEMLQRPEGATMEQIIGATGWQAHTARGTMSGALRKKLGLVVTSEKEAGKSRVYRAKNPD